ncbi:hypothetical protein, partial [Staphylococcus capitis]
IASFKHEGTWKNQDFATGGSTNTVTVTVNGPSMNEIRPVTEQLEKEMKDVNTVTNVSSSLTDSYDAYTLKV